MLYHQIFYCVGFFFNLSSILKNSIQIVGHVVCLFILSLLFSINTMGNL